VLLWWAISTLPAFDVAFHKSLHSNQGLGQQSTEYFDSNAFLPMLPQWLERQS
jgi:hypothetical protein